MRESELSSFLHQHKAMWFGPVICLLLVGVLAAALLTRADAAWAQDGCEVDIRADETAPGDKFDLTFDFSGDCPAPEGDITITLHEDIGVPSRLDDAQVRISAPGRFYPQYVDGGETDDGDHELIVAGCSGWKRTLSGDVVGCDDAGNLTQIRIHDLTLPNRPADDDDEYKVTVSWEEFSPDPGTIGVDATLEVDGDDEVNYGETVRFEGSGFADGLTVAVYADPGTSSASCNDNIGGWREVGNATVKRSGRFTVEVEIAQSDFPDAAKYRICARDGEGVTNGTSIFIEVKPGLEVAGGADRQFAPGEEVILRLVGGRNQGIDSVWVGGQPLGRNLWRQSGDSIQVELPASASGSITTILVDFGSGGRASVNVSLADIELNVSGYPSAGVGLGQRLIARANNLSGASEVIRVTLDGVELTLLDGRRPVETVAVRRGQFSSEVLVDDPNENRVSLLRKLLDDSDGKAKLTIETNNGIKASAEVELAVPTVTVICPNGRECDEDNNTVKRGDTLVIRGAELSRRI